LIAAIGGAALWPLAARAQKAGKIYRLGILTVAPERNWDGLFQALRDLGYVDGQNLIIERRYSEGQAERWSDLANELVGLKVDVIVVSTTPAALAAKKATSTIPIVFPTAFDPVGAGLAASLARPGGNVTGLGLLIPEVSAKGLALLKEAVPAATEVAVFWNAANSANSIVVRDVEATARAIGLAVTPSRYASPRTSSPLLSQLLKNAPMDFSS
jgi:putative ABC transport system substrate-binding protein